MFRDLGIIATAAFQFAGLLISTKKTHTLSQSLVKSNIVDPVAQKIVLYMEENYVNMKKRLFVACVVYVIAALPWFWAYQEYFIAIMMILMAHISNIGWVLHKSRSFQRSKNTNSSSGNAVTPHSTNRNNAFDNNNNNNNNKSVTGSSTTPNQKDKVKSNTSFLENSVIIYSENNQ